MTIVSPQKELEAMDAFRAGDRPKGLALQDEFVAEFREAAKTQDHCSCTKACKYHGKCVECVAIHRAHRDHLPNCFHSMVNDRIEVLSGLTEGSVEQRFKK